MSEHASHAIYTILCCKPCMGLMFQFQAVRNLMSRRPDEAMRSLDEAISDTKEALAESRDAIQGLRSEPVAAGNLAEL